MRYLGSAQNAASKGKALLENQQFSNYAGWSMHVGRTARTRRLTQTSGAPVATELRVSRGGPLIICVTLMHLRLGVAFDLVKTRAAYAAAAL
jgi:hypothetical protein